MITGGGHHDNVSTRVKKKENMAKTYQAPLFVRAANVLTTTMLRAGVKLVGPGNSPMYLLTVPGRKSGQPRTTPIATIEQDGKRYLLTPFGVVDWVRNLRAAAEEVTLTRGRRAETVKARELPNGEAAPILRAFIQSGNPIGNFFKIPAESSLEDFERAVLTHPVFVLERK
jgi:deazaflavin-dependent oxidoreductase (nitroreductase family)